MKWARVKPTGESGFSKQELADSNACFKDFAKEEHMRKTFEHLSHLWVKHPFEFHFESADHYKRFQNRYEIFCGGYLYFYDEKVRSGVVDHVMYFQWTPFKANKDHYTVSIYLSPAPIRKRITKQSLLHKENAALVAEEISMEAGSETNGMQRTAMALTAESNLREGDTGDDFAIDPPPTPPPPPPSMQE